MASGEIRGEGGEVGPTVARALMREKDRRATRGGTIVRLRVKVSHEGGGARSKPLCSAAPRWHAACGRGVRDKERS